MPAGQSQDRRSLLTFIEAMGRVKFTAATPAVRQHLKRLLEEPGISYQRLARVVFSVLKLDPSVHLLLEISRFEDASALKSKLAEPLYQNALNDGLLHAMLRQAVCPDPDFELLFRLLRRSYLDLLTENKGFEPEPHLGMMVALACQCFNNEYIYAVDPPEEERLCQLAELINSSLKKNQPRDSKMTAGLAILAMYRPLGTLEFSRRLLEADGPCCAPELGEVLHRQVRDYFEELAIRDEIQSLGISDDPVSRAVRQHYEESPYPRWLSLNLDEPKPFPEKLRSLFPFLDRFPAENGATQILVAGCGTGSHPIGAAKAFSDSHVLAIDISRVSLSYAKRKAAEYGLSNLEFRHADILCLANLNQRFHLVEASGVLHHMSDPEAALKLLSGLVLPDGIVRIGLYSRRARACLEKAKELIRSRTPARDPNKLRTVRLEILRREDLQDANGWGAKSWTDFYFLSGFRDLLCHPHEVQFTIPEITATLERVGLRFLGFDLDREMREAYQQRFPRDTDLRDLALWEEFEAEQPNTFWGMYHFWTQKIY